MIEFAKKFFQPYYFRDIRVFYRNDKYFVRVGLPFDHEMIEQYDRYTDALKRATEIVFTIEEIKSKDPSKFDIMRKWLRDKSENNLSF
jgi:hypothetical protein